MSKVHALNIDSAQIVYIWNMVAPRIVHVSKINDKWCFRWTTLVCVYFYLCSIGSFVKWIQYSIHNEALYFNGTTLSKSKHAFKTHARLHDFSDFTSSATLCKQRKQKKMKDHFLDKKFFFDRLDQKFARVRPPEIQFSNAQHGIKINCQKEKF